MWAMWTALTARAVGILGGVAAVVWAVTNWGVWPVGVVVLLAVMLIAAVSLWWQERRRPRSSAPDKPDGRQHFHDWQIVGEIRSLVTRDNVNWLQEFDFGGSWRDQWVEPFIRLEHLDDVEHRPLDTELAAALRELFDANAAFTLLLVQHSFRQTNASEKWWNVGWSGSEADFLEGEERELWEERRGALNAAFTSVARAYDGFIDVARRKLML